MANAEPERSDYFAEDRYLTADAANGLLRDPAGTHMLVIPQAWLASLHEYLAAECGPVADQLLATVGRTWGQAFATRFQRELSEYYGAPLAEWPFARLETCIASALAAQGWGRAELDTSRFDQGVFTMTVRQPLTKEPLLAGVLGGMFSALTGQDLEALATGRANGAATFVLALRERLARVTANGHDAVLAELATISV
jgi:hypothetical protein